MKWDLHLGCMILMLGFCFNIQAQNCTELYSSLSDAENITAYSSANGPASFKKKVQSSSISRELLGCENTQAVAWEDLMNEIKRGEPSTGGGANQRKGRNFFEFIASLFKKPKVSSKSDLKYSFLIATYGYDNQADIQKIKEFVASKPWTRGFTIASHLAVDILLLRNNDSERDDKYHTYTKKEMERARNKYAKN